MDYGLTASGGTIAVSSGGTTTGAMLLAGGQEVVSSNGSALSPTISGGDTVDLTQVPFFGTTSAGFAPATDALTVTEGGTQASVQLAPGNYGGVTWSAQADAGGGTQIVACFAAGTRLATPAGPVAVQALRAGDHVVAVSGRLADLAPEPTRSTGMESKRIPRGMGGAGGTQLRAFKVDDAAGIRRHGRDLVERA